MRSLQMNSISSLSVQPNVSLNPRRHRQRTSRYPTDELLSPRKRDRQELI